MSCPFKPAKKNVSLQDGEDVGFEQAYSSIANLEQKQAQNLSSQVNLIGVSDRVSVGESKTSNTIAEAAISLADVEAKLNQDLSPEEQFRSTLQHQSKDVYEAMKSDCTTIEQEIAVNKAS
jgi:hypothetical protein